MNTMIPHRGDQNDHLTAHSIRRIAQRLSAMRQVKMEEEVQRDPQLRHLVSCQRVCQQGSKKIGVLIPGMND